jgi:hypothetical protein
MISLFLRYPFNERGNILSCAKALLSVDRVDPPELNAVDGGVTAISECGIAATSIVHQRGLLSDQVG